MFSCVVARAKGIFNDQSARINDFTGDIKRVSGGGMVGIQFLMLFIVIVIRSVVSIYDIII